MHGTQLSGVVASTTLNSVLELNDLVRLEIGLRAGLLPKFTSTVPGAVPVIRCCCVPTSVDQGSGFNSTSHLYHFPATLKVYPGSEAPLAMLAMSLDNLCSTPRLDFRSRKGGSEIKHDLPRPVVPHELHGCLPNAPNTLGESLERQNKD